MSWETKRERWLREVLEKLETLKEYPQGTDYETSDSRAPGQTTSTSRGANVVPAAGGEPSRKRIGRPPNLAKRAQKEAAKEARQAKRQREREENAAQNEAKKAQEREERKFWRQSKGELRILRAEAARFRKRQTKQRAFTDSMQSGHTSTVPTVLDRQRMRPVQERQTETVECFHCFGCGHICGECKLPVNACRCALDTESIRPCRRCGSSGQVTRGRMVLA